MRFLLLLLINLTLEANLLQEAVDRAAPFSTIKLNAANYKGDVTITKPLKIIGLEDGVVIEGSGRGSVITIKSDGVVLQNLHIRNSGSSMQRIDAGISLKNAADIQIIGCKIEEVLYGIDMEMVRDSLFEKNSITTRKNSIALRGDGLKIYYSHNNTFLNNRIYATRDVTLNYSNFNIFRGNRFEANRYATHLANSHSNRFIQNKYSANSVAMMFMGTKDTEVIENSIVSSKGAAGIGVMIGGVSNFTLKKNRISFNAKAIYIQGQEKGVGMKRYIIDNEISYNKEALHFHATIKDNTIRKNRIFGNIDDVVKDVSGGFGSNNVVEYNYWDRYAGFDRDRDGVGDTPHEVYQYSDMLWHHNHKIKFFYASPVLTLLNFLSNLAPFVEPNLIMRDEKPTYLSP